MGAHYFLRDTGCTMNLRSSATRFLGIEGQLMESPASAQQPDRTRTRQEFFDYVAKWVNSLSGFPLKVGAMETLRLAYPT